MDKETPSKEGHSFRDELFCFVPAFIKKWEAWIVFVLGGGVGSFYQARGNDVSANTLFIIGVIGLLAAAFLTWRDEHRKVLAFQKDALDFLDRVILDCVDRLREGDSPEMALMKAKADELKTNDDLLRVCDLLESKGHRPYFGDSGVFPYPRNVALQVLKEMRLRGADYTQRGVYEFGKTLLEEMEAIRSRK